MENQDNEIEKTRSNEQIVSPEKELPPEAVKVIQELRQFRVKSGFSEATIFDKLTPEHISSIINLRTEEIKLGNEERNATRNFYFRCLIAILIFLTICVVFLGFKDISAFIELIKLVGQSIALIIAGAGLTSLVFKKK